MNRLSITNLEARMLFITSVSVATGCGQGPSFHDVGTTQVRSEAQGADAEAQRSNGTVPVASEPKAKGPADDIDDASGTGADSSNTGGVDANGVGDADANDDARGGDGTSSGGASDADIDSGAGGVAGGEGDGSTGGTMPTANANPDDQDNSSVDTAPKVVMRCGTGTVKSVTQRLEFADPGKTCDWNLNGNGGRIDRKVRARVEQSAALTLPANAIICELDFAFSELTMKYDDEIILTFNDTILAASQDYGSRFERDGDFLKYDWARLKDADYDHNLHPQYCLGGSCEIPQTETSGTMQLDFTPDVVHQLSAKAIAAKRFDLGFVTIGDNDDSDCRHSAFGFDVTITYVQ